MIIDRTKSDTEIINVKVFWTSDENQNQNIACNVFPLKFGLVFCPDLC